MIHISDKHNCCGCHACVSVCAHHCITMQADEEGFLYPVVDKETCTDCGLCEKVCPVINQGSPRKPLKVYAAKNNDEEIRKQSSSGGIFTLLAESVIKDGGIVFGAKFDKEWNVVHDWTDTIEGIADFRGSKYVQSTIGNTYSEAREFLKQGRKVLFSGTPCQIAGLKKFLRKEYNNLLTVDVVCHGVPSPQIWKEYLQSLKLENIGHISHKDKSTGWRGYSFSIENNNKRILFAEKASKNKFMIASFLNLTLRPSCFSCPAKAGKSNSDITLGDFWGIEKVFPQMDDNKGASLLCCNTLRGQFFLEQLNLQVPPTDYQQAVVYNSCIEYSTVEPKERHDFWNNYYEIGINALFKLKMQSQNIFIRIFKRIFK